MQTCIGIKSGDRDGPTERKGYLVNVLLILSATFAQIVWAISIDN